MPGSMPEGWRRVRLREIAEINPESWDPRDGGTIRYLDLSAITAPGAVTEPILLEAAKAPSRARRKVRSGDIVASTVRPYLRGFARLEAVPENLIVSTGFAVVRSNGKSDGEFLYQHILSPAFIAHLEPRMTGSNYPAVRPEDVGDYQLLLPPLPEQRAIAAVLDAVDDTIERTEAVIAATEELRRALLHELLTRGVPGMHSEWKHVPGLGTVPACWEVTTLGECLDGIEAGRSPLAESRSARDGEWGVLKVSSVSWGDFRPQENKALIAGTQPEPRFEVRPGDVLLSRANTPDLVGRAVLVKTTPPKLLLSDKTLRLIPNRARITREFLLVALSTPSARTQISGSASGSSRSMFNVSQEALRGTQLALPPLAEQRRIAELLTTAADTSASARDEADALECMKVTLADELLSGSLRVGAKTEAPA